MPADLYINNDHKIASFTTNYVVDKISEQAFYSEKFLMLCRLNQGGD